ncbi:MAG: hypothetical protein HYU58_01490 [Proteobacteria bacterium]|nr:hypothetical protein [Pseudomonadota bacterium]
MPLIAAKAGFAASRQRAFLAGARSALAGHAMGPEIGNRAIQHIFIVNPVKEFASKPNAPFADHPSIEEWIERLQNLGKA